MHRALLAAVLGCAVAAPSISRAAVVYQTGFESPTFSTGDLVGQDSWDRFDTDAPQTNVPITVQTSTVQSGSQAVQIQNNAGISGESTFAFRDFAPINPVSAGTPLVTVTWGMNVSNTGTGTSHDWGLEIYDQNVNLVAGAGMGKGVGGSTTVTGTAPDPDQIGDPNGSIFVDYGPGPSMAAWHNYTLTLDYSLDAYSIAVDGVTKGFGVFSPGTDGTLGEVDFFENGRDNDSAFFDNLSITTGTGVVPEPASLGLLGLAGVTLMGRRRKA